MGSRDMIWRTMGNVASSEPSRPERGISVAVSRRELPIGGADNNEPGAEAAEFSVKPQLEVELKSERKLTELTSLCVPLTF